MSDAATVALPALSPFEGKEVRRVGIEIPGLAGGLRDAMKVAPEEHPQGATVFVVVECQVAKVRHEPIDRDAPAGDQRRVEVMTAVTATLVDGALVSEHLDRHREQVARMVEAEAGVQRIPTDEELHAAHSNGEHSLYAAGCVDCDQAAIEAAGFAPDPDGDEPIPITGRRTRQTGEGAAE